MPSCATAASPRQARPTSCGRSRRTRTSRAFSVSRSALARPSALKQSRCAAAGPGERGDGVVESAVRHGPTVQTPDPAERRRVACSRGDRPRPPRDRRARHRRHRPGRSRRAHVIRRRVIVHGFVQGVFFRDTVRRQRDRAEYSGWVRNTRTGRWKRSSKATAGAVERLVAVCQEGPRGARVDRVEIASRGPGGSRRLPTSV